MVEAWVSVEAAPVVLLMLARWWRGRRKDRRRVCGRGRAIVGSRRERGRMRCIWMVSVAVVMDTGCNFL